MGEKDENRPETTASTPAREPQRTEYEVADNEPSKSPESEDATERPVRQKLEETTIEGAGLNQDGQSAGSDDGDDRKGRKRSIDDLHEETESNNKENNAHRRKKSKDGRHDGKTRTPSPQAKEGEAASPMRKRSRNQLDKEHETTTEKSEGGGKASEDEPEKKKARDNSQERKESKPHPFSNSSSVSPFAAISSPKKEPSGPSSPDKHVASSSAFASSSLAAFAGSTTSPFGALAANNSTSPFKKNTSIGDEKPGLAPSPFASKPLSSFASPVAGGFAASPFASATGFGASATAPRLTSFASGAAQKPEQKPKPLGVDDEGDGVKKPEGLKSADEEKKDERFFEQKISTGEEHEKTHFSSRAKLFRFDGGEWRERGTGSFKVNVTEASPDKKAEHPESKKSARLLMRAEGVLHVILNLPVVKGMKVGDPSGNPPSGKQVNVIGVENGKPAIYVVRMHNEEFAKQVYHLIEQLKEEI